MPINIKAEMKSKEERLFSRQVNILLALEEFEGLELIEATYEALKFQLPGGLYTPDFYIKAANEGGGMTLIMVEVKGSKKQKGYRSSRQKLRAAASLYPEYLWVMVIMDRGRGLIGEIEILNEKVKEFTRITGGNHG